VRGGAEVVQTHPVHVNVISEGDDDDDEDEEDDDDDEEGEDAEVEQGTTTPKRKTTRKPMFSRGAHSVVHAAPASSGAARSRLSLCCSRWRVRLPAWPRHRARCRSRPPGAAEPQQKPRYDDCILYGNVFTQDGHLLPDADVHVRRATDRSRSGKPHPTGRGEFAVRVPPGPDYVIEVKARGS